MLWGIMSLSKQKFFEKRENMIKQYHREKADNTKDKKAKKRGLMLALISASALFIGACGSSEETVSEENVPEYVYVPEYIELSGSENASFYNTQIMGGTMYYISNLWDETAMTSTTQIYRFTPGEDEEPVPLPVELQENVNINSFSVDKDGNIYLCLYDYSGQKADAEGFMIGKTLVGKYDAQGTQIYEQDITDIISEDQENNYVNGIVADDEGRLYLSSSYLIRLFDAQGNYQGAVNTDQNYINNMGKGKDGKIYISYYDSASASGGMVLSDIDFDAKKLGNSYADFPSGSSSNVLASGAEKDFLVNDGTKLSEYDLETQTSEELLEWLDSDINGQYVDGVGALADGRIVAIIRDWNRNMTINEAYKYYQDKFFRLPGVTISIDEPRNVEVLGFKDKDKYIYLQSGSTMMDTRDPNKLSHTIDYMEPLSKYYNKDGKKKDTISKKEAIGLSLEYYNEFHKDEEEAQKVKVYKHISFHTARHTCATILLYNGVQLTTVQKLLGHQSIRTTEVYSDIMDMTVIRDLQKIKQKKNK